MELQLKRELLVAGLSVAVLRTVGAALGFLVTVVLGRTLGPAGLGIFAYLVTIVALSAVPVSNGWGTLLLKAASSSAATGNWLEAVGLFRRGMHLAVVVSLIFLVGLLLFRSVEVATKYHLGPEIAVVLAAILLADQVSALRAAILRGINSPTLAQVPEMIVRPSLVIFGIYVSEQFLSSGLTLTSAFTILLIAATIAASIGYLLLAKAGPAALFASQTVYRTKSWCFSAAPIALSSGMIVLNAHLGFLILGMFVDAATIGVYRVAVQISLVSGLTYTSLNMLASQRFAYYWARGEDRSVATVAKFMSRVSALIAAVILLFLLAWGRELLVIVFGEKFEGAFAPMVILVIGQVFSASIGMAQPLLLMRGLEMKVLRWTAISVVLGLLLCLAAVPYLGQVGAAVGTIIAAIVWNLGLWREARFGVGIDTSILSTTRNVAN